MVAINSKRGLAAQTIVVLIIAIAAGIVVLLLVSTLAGYLSPETAVFSCGLNVRMRSAAIHSTFGVIPAPLVMCNQYNTPVNINAADFKKCPEIADFCSKIDSFSLSSQEKNSVKYQCYQQCARIQINNLVDSCWEMAGSGHAELWSLWDRLQRVEESVVNALKAEWDFITLPFKFNPLYYYFVSDPIKELKKDVGNLFEQKAAILRCYRFQIINPVTIPGSKQQLANYYDFTFGRSWAYNITNPKVCKPSKENNICSFGGQGVKYINEMYINETGEGNKFNVSGQEVAIPKDWSQLVPGEFLVYNTTAKQICYIAYYQFEKGEKRTIISCDSWTAYAGSSTYLN
jgi:hypothetical protein